MSRARAGLGIALSALLALPPTLRPAAAAEPQAPERTLRAAGFEPAPAALGQGRFRLRARLHPAPAPHLDGRTGPLKLTAALGPKANLAACPLPGAIFSDGFEAP